MSLKDRYSRQIRFRPLGEEGQARIAAAHVLLVGVGALGTHLASTLVRAGVGALTLVDRDVVEESNLPRQTLFDEHDARIGAPKAVAAAEKLLAVNSACAIEAIADEFTLHTWDALPRRPALILDGTDNFATRYLLNDLAVRDGVPWIYGAAVGAEGMALAVRPQLTPCLRCLIPEAPPTGEGPTCETAGVVEPIISAITAFQSIEALKILAGRTESLVRGLYCVDLWHGSHTRYFADAPRDPACRACGTRELPALFAPAPESTSLCGRNAVQVLPLGAGGVDLARLAQNLAGAVEDIERTPHLLRFSAEGCRFSVFRGGRAILFGTEDLRRARILYDRFVGAR